MESHIQKSTIAGATMVSLLAAIMLLTCLALPICTAASSPTKASYAPDKILMKPKVGVSQTRMESLHATNGAKALRVFQKMGNMQVVSVPKGRTVEEMIDKYQKSGLVEYAEPDYIRHLYSTPPDDSLFREQWSMQNIGQYGGLYGADIGAVDAWAIRQDASDVVVAVVDYGVYYPHEDLAANMWTNPGEFGRKAGVDDDGNDYVDDIHGIDAFMDDGDPLDGGCDHGTHVAGIIGAVANNGKGIAGIASPVKIMALCLGQTTQFGCRDGESLDDDIIQCINYACNKQADVINCSFGAETYSASVQTAFQRTLDPDQNPNTDDTIIVVCAAGNDAKSNDDTLDYPSCYPQDNIVSVAATNRYDELVSYSNYGITTVDLAAPGDEILSTVANGGYGVMSGTSMAAPHVSGAVALLKAQFPSDDYHQIINRLLRSVDPLPTLEGKCVSGGRLNLHSALVAPMANMDVLPIKDCLFGGKPGGPFYGDYAYRITNTDDSMMQWTAASSENWLTLSATGGTLMPGESAQVQVSVNSGALSLGAGLYTSTVTFTNLSGTGSTTRTVRLTAGPVYVDKNAPGPVHDGTSWANAHTSIAEGIGRAFPTQEVWVADGTYTENVTLRSNISLYGGFAGTEDQRDERDPIANTTVIDGGNRDSAVKIVDCADTGIDGFTIRNGNAAAGAGIRCVGSSATIADNTITLNTGDTLQSRGAGICCSNASASISQNRITGNVASTNGQGGGIFCESSIATISDNVITGNSAGQGGGIYVASGDIVVVRNDVITNEATQGYMQPPPGWAVQGMLGGGGICVYSCNSAVISNNGIVGNKSGDYSMGSGMYCQPTGDPSKVFHLCNNTITGNGSLNPQATVYAGGLFLGVVSYEAEDALIANNLVTDNDGIQVWYEGPWYAGATDPAYRSNDVYAEQQYRYEGFFLEPGNPESRQDPTGADGNISIDPQLAADNVHLETLSPCIDSGNDSAVSTNDRDIDGQPRIIDSHVDIGADEAAPVSTINEAKAAPDSTLVTVPGCRVSASFTGKGGNQVAFAIESSDRIAGIRVIPDEGAYFPSPVGVGDDVTVTGTVDDTPEGERVLRAQGVTVVSSGNTPLEPFNITGFDTGGGTFGHQEAVVDDASTSPTPLMSYGVNNVGLFMKIRGKVTAVQNTGGYDGYFYVDDAGEVIASGDDLYPMGLNDGSGARGIRCRAVDPTNMPTVGDYIEAEGVMGVTKVDGINVRYFWTTMCGLATFTQYSKSYCEGQKYLSLPAQPENADPAAVFADPGIIEGTLYRWERRMQSFPYYSVYSPMLFGAMSNTEGWIFSPVDDGTLSYQGYTLDEHDVWIRLGRAYGPTTWAIIGVPFTHNTLCADWKVTDGSELLGCSAAANAGWIDSIAFGWDEITQQQTSVDVTLGNTQFNAWNGYWVVSHRDLAIIAPASSMAP